MFICDAATIDSDGKVSVLGIFDYLWFYNFPANWNQLCVVLCLSVDLNDVGTQHEVIIQPVNEDNCPIGSPGKYSFISQNDGNYHLITYINDISFEKFDNYKFDVFIDNKYSKSFPLNVKKKAISN